MYIVRYICPFEKHIFACISICIVMYQPEAANCLSGRGMCLPHPSSNLEQLLSCRLQVSLHPVQACICVLAPLTSQCMDGIVLQ